jgi:membrane fusion protein, copper/silver efflux system
MSTRSRVMGRPGILLGWRSGALVAGTTLGLVLGALYLQHRRHAWPFSLHHGLAGSASSTPLASRQSAQSGPLGLHPRGAVALDGQQIARLGIRIEPVRREVIARTVRAVAAIVPDESRVSHVHTRVAGWIEKLHVTTTGQPVRAGQPLAEIFSQELLASQSEYLAARAVGAGDAFAEAARARLKVLGFSDAQIAELERRGTPARTITVVAPRGGVVLRRGIAAGTAVDPATEILTLGDLSRVWAIAEIPEGDIPGMKVGMLALLSFPASGLAAMDAKIAFLAPTLSERTRTLRARFELDNRGGSLRPGLYGTAELRSEPREALTVLRDAVVDTGAQRLVFVATEPASFEPMPVELGIRVGDRVEVRRGLSEGQMVVSAGVFLVDSESRLRASGGAGTGHSHGHGPSGAAPPAPSGLPATQGHEGHDPSGSGRLPVAPQQGPARKVTGHEGH